MIAAAQIGIRDEVAALKRARTLEAAAELFYENGYENTTLDSVAERLGVSKPFIYSQFGSKSELLAEISSRGISTSLEAINSVASLNISPTEKLRLLSERFVTAVLKSQVHLAIFFREEKNLATADLEQINSMRREFDRKLTALLQQGVKAGEFEIADIKMAALAIGGMVSWAYVWYRPKGRLPLEKVVRLLSDFILKMVGIALR